MKKQKRDGGSSSGRIADARFASFETDPRFRLPSKKHTKTTIDKRFSGMLDDDDFIATAKVDRYGRKIQSDAKKKALQRLYQTEDGDGDEKEGEEEEEEDDVDDDELVQRELRAAHEKAIQKRHDPARQGGFSSSESDSDDSSADEEEDQEGEAMGLVAHHDMRRLEGQQSDVDGGEVTSRLAIVNLDWDHVNSTDLMALFSSFLPPGSGRILKISIYPSEFGKERMQQEEVEGPPKALFRDEPEPDSSDIDSDSDSDNADEEIKKGLIEEGDDQDFDSDALRSYQLDRLRYYYAVMVCSSPETAKHIYEATDGTEYQSSSNVIDLRFVPEDVAFDDEARDECSKAPESYKPVDFVTNALQSSKVKLTWDMRPEEASRKESINRAFSGSRNELEENDLRAYLASDSDGEEEDVNEGADDQSEAGEPKLTKKELTRKKMREALGLADEAASSRAKDGPVGEMQITFAPALTDRKAKGPEQEETTIDKYKRKERERKERKRQDAKARRETASQGQEKDKEVGEDGEDDAGFDDPFFTTEEASAAPSKTSMRKDERRKKREARQAAEAELAEQAARLSQVMAEGADDNRAGHLEHFDMSEIVRAEKEEGKKARRKKKKNEASSGRGGLQQGFEMDVGDDRFNAVFDSHEYAIDPSNPKFKATGGMKKLLEEGRNKRKAGDNVERGELARGSGRTSKRAKKGAR